MLGGRSRICLIKILYDYFWPSDPIEGARPEADIPELPSIVHSDGVDSDRSDVPERDGSGKVHGPLPDYPPDYWTNDDIESAIEELEASVEERKDELENLGEHGPHRDRIRREERLLRQLKKKRQETREHSFE